MKLTGTFHEYANAPKKLCGMSPHHYCPRGSRLNEAAHHNPMHVCTQCVSRQKHITFANNNITSQPFIKWLHKTKFTGTHSRTLLSVSISPLLRLTAKIPKELLFSLHVWSPVSWWLWPGVDILGVVIPLWCDGSPASNTTVCVHCWMKRLMPFRYIVRINPLKNLQTENSKQ